MQTKTQAQSSPLKKGEVAVTGTFLSLVKALHAARTMFISESWMASDLKMTPPLDWHSRCRTLFYKTYAEHIEAIGLCCNDITFESLMSLKVPAEAWSMEFDLLPTKFVFDPWLGQGHGGIRLIESGCWAVSLKMEDGALFDWKGQADDKDHAEGQAIAEATSQTSQQVFDTLSVTLLAS